MSEGLVELLIMSSTCSDSPLLAFFNLTGNAIKCSPCLNTITGTPSLFNTLLIKSFLTFSFVPFFKTKLPP